MNIPSIPTDNLYKFSALIGTIIVFLSLYVPYILSSELSKQISYLELKVKTSEAESDYFGDKVRAVEKIIDNSIAAQKGIRKHDPNKLELNYSENELKVFLSELIELKKSRAISRAEEDNLLSETKRLNSEYDLIQNISRSFIIFGAILACFGYILWYFRIQIYQDRALKELSHESKKAK
jgi:hypothetical protein